MLKTILSLEQLDEMKAFRLLSTTSVDVAQLDEVKDLAEVNLEPGNLARLALTTRFIKVFQSAVLLYVSSLAKKQQSAISKAQDECSYAKMIEDLTR